LTPSRLEKVHDISLMMVIQKLYPPADLYRTNNDKLNNYSPTKK